MTEHAPSHEQPLKEIRIPDAIATAYGNGLRNLMQDDLQEVTRLVGLLESPETVDFTTPIAGGITHIRNLYEGLMTAKESKAIPFGHGYALTFSEEKKDETQPIPGEVTVDGDMYATLASASAHEVNNALAIFGNAEVIGIYYPEKQELSEQLLAVADRITDRTRPLFDARHVEGITITTDEQQQTTFTIIPKAATTP